METAPDQAEKQIEIHCEAAAKLNFACHQNAYAVLRDLRVENCSDELALGDLTVSIESDPQFLKAKSWTLDRVEAGAVVSVGSRDLELNAQFLTELNESVRGTLRISVEQDGATLAEHSQPIELLARNEWGGAGYMPELLAAFSLPNDPAVDRIIHEASQLLAAAGQDTTIDGYKSGSRQRVWEITAAIYAAVANLGLSYSTPPASFESDGQKIRLPHQILQGGVATCLDSALLLAAAFEQAGLNPILALLDGHALVGAWLQPEKLASVINDEAEILRKRFQLKELVLVESTLVTSHPAPPFSKAVERAMAQLAPELDDKFITAVDIARARAHSIAPLALPSQAATPSEEIEASEQVEVALEAAPALPNFDHEVEEEKPDTPEGRIERWQRKLLDLSARNPLLNHRSTKSSVPIVCPDPGRLEDRLAEGKKIAILPAPPASAQEQDREIHLERTGESIDDTYARDALEQNQVLVNLPKAELDKRSVEIYRKARTSLQEGGANTLYLALGFLLWKRDEEDTRRFRAPLILMPVSLQRKSVRSGIKMLAHDDEVRFNTTLLEMLRKDFGIELPGLEDGLPQDESGVDVASVWDRVRRAVVDSAGFEVVEDVVLGHFSFSKYLMWKDMVDRTGALRKNAIVRHLVDTPRDPFPSEVEFVERAAIDREFSPADFLAPLPADSAQMAAVASAKQGKNFIVIGPPGTGKSQTISNLIAHFLGSDKTVLFVSEKTAALDVVYRRLDEIGLGRFCLELHSNKARKSDVLAQLKNAWETSEERTADEWQAEANRLKFLRDRLNTLVDHLHRVHDNGLTAHYAIGLKVQQEERGKRVRFDWPNANQHNQVQLENMRQAAELLQVQASNVGQISGSPMQLIAHGDWSPSWEGELVDRAGQLSKSARAALNACNSMCDAIGVQLTDRKLDRLDALAELAEFLQRAHRQQVAFALEGNGQDLIDALAQAATHLAAYQTALTKLSCKYEAMAWRKLDGDSLAARWAEANSAWFAKSFFVKRAIRNEMREGGAQGDPDPGKDAAVLAELRREGEAIDRLGTQLQSLQAWKAHDSDSSELTQIREIAQGIRGSVSRLADTAPQLGSLRESLVELLGVGNDLLAADAPTGRALADFVSAKARFDSDCEPFDASAAKTVRDSFLEDEDALGEIATTLDAIVRRRTELNHWCGWQRRRNEAIAIELGPFVAAIEDGTIPINEIPESFEAAYCTWWSKRLFDQDEVLRSFSSAEHTDTIAKFRQADSAFQESTAQYVAAKLSARLPGQSDVPQSSQWGLLKREITKRARHKPVRQLMQEAPEALTRLAPCLMMSPLSVAQYLPPEQEPFDVVIFDEASQITVWDAVGTIARGKQMIVAGDPKQMPPTNFFARSDDDADGDIDYEGDLESILDELRSSNVPEMVLNLHYRSRRESLIAFSNKRYYDSQLVTFPAPVHPDMGVSLVHPEGYYDRGKTRTNEGEARAIVSEIVRRLTSTDLELRNSTIGVVTFNSEQQTLIQDLLDQRRAEQPEIEWAFAEDCLEPVFVKNLETVQGDERDVILFSVTYGPDQSDKIYMNFGPLNREGGERRLNVAMTRARSEMVVFSTLHPDRIDLSRTSARAVADLKNFLEYASRGPAALGASVHGSLGDFESPFEAAVAEGLRAMGWTIHPQIGVSAFRVDLGVVHPDHPGVYLTGVECDGAMYCSASYARERDKIRQAVLQGLGWNLLRAWSNDWWLDKDAALQALDAQLREQLETDRARAAMPAEIEPSSEAKIEEPEAAPDTEQVEQSEEEELRGTPYQLAAIEIDTAKCELDEMTSAELVEPIAQIVEVESPLHIEDLTRRIIHAAELTRASSKVKESIQAALQIAIQQGKLRMDGDFLWKASSDDFAVRNRSQLPASDKKFDRIAPQEIARALSQVVQRNFSLSENDAFSEAAKDLGFQRVTAAVGERIRAELEKLEANGEVSRDGDKLASPQTP